MNRILPHVELLQEYFQSRGIPFGSPGDLHAFAKRLPELPVVQEEVASILRSVLYAEDLQLKPSDLLDLLCASLHNKWPGDPPSSDRDLALFVNRAVRSVQTGILEPVAPPPAFDGPAPGETESPLPLSTLAYEQPPTQDRLPPVAPSPIFIPDPSLPSPRDASPDAPGRTLAAALEFASSHHWVPATPEPQWPFPEARLPPRPQNAPSASPATVASLPTHTHRTSRHPKLNRTAVLCTGSALVGLSLGALLPHRSPARVQAHTSIRPTAASSQAAPVASEPPAAAPASACALLPPGGQAPPVAPTLITAPANAVPRISTVTACQLLLAAPPPVYPTLASLTQLRGVVPLEFIISPRGTVTATHVLGGPALLRGAAEDAVHQWRFRPYVQNGRAQQVSTVAYLAFAPPPAAAGN